MILQYDHITSKISCLIIDTLAPDKRQPCHLLDVYAVVMAAYTSVFAVMTERLSLNASKDLKYPLLHKNNQK